MKKHKHHFHLNRTLTMAIGEYYFKCRECDSMLIVPKHNFWR